MARTSKFLGKVYDGKWEIINAKYDEDTNHMLYTLKDQMNGREIIIADSTLRKVINGKTTISHIIYERINKQQRGEKMKPWQKTILK